MNVRPRPDSSVPPIELAREADFELGGAHIRPSVREIEASGVVERLEPRVMQVLVALARAKGAVVSRDDLTASCWDGLAVGDDAINRTVGKLRRIVEGLGGCFSIETVTKVGYRLMPCATEQDQEAVVQAARTEAPQRRLLRNTSRTISLWLRDIPKHPLRISLAAALAAITIGAFGFALWPRPQTPYADVAVLRFEAQNHDADTQFLADGIQLQLQDLLSQAGVKVGLPNSVAAGKGPRLCIDGAVRRQGDTLVVVARVFDARRDVIVWSQSYEARSVETDTLPERIATAFVTDAALDAPRHALFEADEEARRVAIGTLRAVSLYFSGDQLGAYHVTRQLAASAPNSAQAQSAFAIQSTNILAYLPIAERSVVLDNARAAAHRALRLDPSSGFVRLALAVTTPTLDWATREVHLRQCLRVEPEFGLCAMALAADLESTGRLREALEISTASLSGGPAGRLKLRSHAITLALNGRTDEARALLTRVDRIWPNFGITGVRYVLAVIRGDWSEAEFLLDKPGVEPDVQKRRRLHRVLTALRLSRGDTTALETDCLASNGSRTCFQGLASLGRRDAAFHVVNDAYPDLRGDSAAARNARAAETAFDPFEATYLFTPNLESLRADPRFIPVVERLGLLDYWRASGHWPDFCEDEPQSVCAQMRGTQRLSLNHAKR